MWYQYIRLRSVNGVFLIQLICGIADEHGDNCNWQAITFLIIESEYKAEDYV